jgi:hypothetical protein
VIGKRRANKTLTVPRVTLRCGDRGCSNKVLAQRVDPIEPGSRALTT